MQSQQKTSTDAKTMDSSLLGKRMRPSAKPKSKFDTESTMEASMVMTTSGNVET
jgi:hypothetical protein